MLSKIKKLLNNNSWRRLRDVRLLGLGVFMVIVLLVTWSGVRVIETNYGLQQQIARLEQENKIIELENNNQNLTNRYYASERYQQLQARRLFSRGLPGERLILVPRAVALKEVEMLPAATPERPAKNPPTWQRNLNAWRQFFWRSSGASGGS